MADACEFTLTSLTKNPNSSYASYKIDTTNDAAAKILTFIGWPGESYVRNYYENKSELSQWQQTAAAAAKILSFNRWPSETPGQKYHGNRTQGTQRRHANLARKNPNFIQKRQMRPRMHEKQKAQHLNKQLQILKKLIETRFASNSIMRMQEVLEASQNE